MQARRAPPPHIAHSHSLHQTQPFSQKFLHRHPYHGKKSPGIYPGQQHPSRSHHRSPVRALCYPVSLYYQASASDHASPQQPQQPLVRDRQLPVQRAASSTAPAISLHPPKPTQGLLLLQTPQTTDTLACTRCAGARRLALFYSLLFSPSHPR